MNHQRIETNPEFEEWIEKINSIYRRHGHQARKLAITEFEELLLHETDPHGRYRRWVKLLKTYSLSRGPGGSKGAL